MSYAPSSTYFDQEGTILGCFREKDHDRLFEFSVNDDGCEFGANYPHKVWVTTPKEGIDQGYRYAKVLKTVCYILTDNWDWNNRDGGPTLERWYIKNHSLYPNPYGDNS